MKAPAFSPDADFSRDYHGFTEDFDHFVTADRWTVTASDAGGVAVSDAAGGIATVSPSDGTIADNDETYLHTTTELFKFVAEKPIIIEADLKFAQAGTNQANIMFGLMDGIAANALVDNGAGPKASYAGAVFFAVDGDTTWRVENSDGATQKTTELDADGAYDGVAKTAASTAYQTLRIEVWPKSSTKMDITFWIDGHLVAKHVDQTYANATEMAVVFGAKNGDADDHEILYVDRVTAFQRR